MKLEVTQENLQHALTLVGHIAAGRTTLPVLSNILISTVGKQLKLAATNLELGVTHIIGAKVDGQGSITVPAKLMTDFVSSLPPSNIKIVVDGQKIHIEAGQFKSTINGMVADEFPSIPEVKNRSGIKIAAGEFKTTLQQVIFAASSDETRPVLTACQLYTEGKELFLVATDSYRLAEKHLRGVNKAEEVPSLLIPARSLNELLRILDDSFEDIELVWDEAQAELRFGSTTIVTRLIDGKYPAYRELIPKTGEMSFTMKRDELQRIVKVAGLFAKDSAGGITLTIDDQKQQVSIHSIASQVGENTSTASAKVTGAGEVTLNSRYLLDGLNALNSAEVTFTANGKLNPCVLSVKDEPDYLHVIMPLRS